MTAALSIIDIQYVRFEVEMDGVRKIFEFVSDLSLYWISETIQRKRGTRGPKGDYKTEGRTIGLKGGP